MQLSFAIEVDMSFAVDMERFMKTTKSDAETAVAKIIVIALQGIMTKTPVDTGRARGNWNVAHSRPDLSVSDEGYPESDGVIGAETAGAAQSAATQNAKQYAKAKGLGTIAVRVGGDVYISNNLPYIRGLEYGASQQSNGMVRRTMADIKARFGS